MAGLERSDVVAIFAGLPAGPVTKVSGGGGGVDGEGAAMVVRSAAPALC